MDPVFFLIGLLLMAFGLLGVGVAEPGLLNAHLLRVGVALLALLLGALLPPGLLLRFARGLLLFTLGLLVLVLLVGDGPGGVRRWLDLGPLDFQPSELAKLTLVVYLASFLGRKGQDHPIIGPVAAIGFMVGLVLIEPDFATALFLAFLALALFVLAGVPWRRLFTIGAFLLLVISPFSGIYLTRFQYVSERFQGFLGYLRGEADPREEAYQVFQAKKAMLLGGPFGQGPGGVLPHLPEAHNDMIFASVVFATGWLGGGMVFLLYLLLFLRGVRLALNLPGGYSVLALGLTLYLTLQAWLNIGVTLGVLPVTGIPLPFLSFGGSSLLVSSLALGLLLGLARIEPRREVAR